MGNFHLRQFASQLVATLEEVLQSVVVGIGYKAACRRQLFSLCMEKMLLFLFKISTSMLFHYVFSDKHSELKRLMVV